MKDCSSDFLIIYSQSMPSHSHPAFGSAWMLEGHRANASVFSLESAQGISAGWKHSHRYASEAARGLMRMRVWVWLSFTAPRSSLLPSTGTLFLPSFPFLSLPSLIWHCLTIRYTRACMLPTLFFFFHARVHPKTSPLQICGPCMGCMFVWCSQKSISHVWGLSQDRDRERTSDGKSGGAKKQRSVM